MNKLIASLLTILSLSTFARAENNASAPPTPAPYVLVSPAEAHQLRDQHVRKGRAQIVVGALLLGVGFSVGAGLMATGGYYYPREGGENDIMGMIYLGAGAAVLTSLSIPGSIMIADGISQGKKARVQLTSVGIGPTQGGAVASFGIKY